MMSWSCCRPIRPSRRHPDKVEHALKHPGAQPDGWTGPASYGSSHLRKRSPETVVAIIAAAFSGLWGHIFAWP
jgi:hypothetical protein